MDWICLQTILGIVTKTCQRGWTMPWSELQDKWQSRAHYELMGCFSTIKAATTFPLYFVSSGYLFCCMRKLGFKDVFCELTLFLTKLFLCVSSANWSLSVAIWFNGLNRNLRAQTKQRYKSQHVQRNVIPFCGEVKSKITELYYIAYPAGHLKNWDFRVARFCRIMSHKQSKVQISVTSLFPLCGHKQCCCCWRVLAVYCASTYP